MFKSVRSKRAQQTQAELQMTPLIDMVFILLIFFVVTASFVSETGMGIQRPRASSAEPLPQESVPVTIDSIGRITVDGRMTTLFSLRPLIERRLRTQPGLAVVIVADRAVSMDRTVRVMDEIRGAGITRIALAATREE